MDILNHPEKVVFGLDIGTRSIVGTVGYKQNEHDFIVVAHAVKCHETRAMLDGQIHDIGRVAETIKGVKKELEKQLGRKLNEVCIAAAGRVLKTVIAHADYEFLTDTTVTDEHIHSLELMGVEKAYEEMRKVTDVSEGRFFCVGYSVMHYYLNDTVITNLEAHKAAKIGVELIATFLPEEVIDGLYTAVEKAELTVDNLTLEPIAAINVAIPEKFRLLNIALVDVGAGTSDICITNDGSITGYGMIPKAGDAITEKIMKSCLVEFSEAENIKMQAAKKKKSISYTDVLGLPGKTSADDVGEMIKDVITEITGDIAEKIKELNGGKSVSAVFVVGGGGKHYLFTETLAKHLDIVPERVALRGEEVLGNVTFLQSDVIKDPLLVTPVGICLNYYEQRNNFIFVIVNSESVKLYDNNKLTVMDAVIAHGFPNDRIFPRRGKSIYFTLNGATRLIRGEAGEAAYITLNGKQTDLNASVMKNDIIEIKESTAGKDAYYEVNQLPEYNKDISFNVNGRNVVCQKFIMANGELVSGFYSIKDGDELNILNYYTLRQILEFMDIDRYGRIFVNNVPATLNDKVYENFTIDIELPDENGMITSESEPVSYNDLPEAEPDEYGHNNERMDNLSGQNVSEAAGEPYISVSDSENSHEVLKESETADKVTDGKTSKTADIAVSEEKTVIRVYVNGTMVTLSGKSRYIFVDILDVYEFDLSTVQGSAVILKVNGEKADFTTPLSDGAAVELYWEK